MAGKAAGRVVRGLGHLGTAGIVTAVVLAIATLLFGRGELDPAAAAETVAAASLDVLEANVDRQAIGESTFAPATDNAVLSTGDIVRTDATGFAQVDWSDGSLARLDVNTQMTIVGLAEDALAPEITARLDEGRVWNRVQAVTGQHGSYEVETPVGTAAVRGTAFSIACTAAGVCTIVVWDGVVEVATPDGGIVRIEAGETVVIASADEAEGAPILPPVDPTPGPTPTPSPTPTDGPTPEPPAAQFVEVSRESTTPDQQERDDAWISTNVRLDEETGRFGPEREGCAATLDGRNARLAGTPDAAIELDANQDAEAVGLTIAPLDTYGVRISMLGREFDAGSGRVTTDSQEFRQTVEVEKYAVFGVGLYEVAAVTTGVTCRIDGFVLIGGRSPFTTVLGILATVLSLLGLALVSAAARGKHGRSTGGRRIRGAIAGAVGGVGLAVLLQQFGLFVLTPTLVGGWAAGTAAVGGLAPRPSPTSGSPAPQPPQETAPDPTDAPDDPDDPDEAA